MTIRKMFPVLFVAVMAVAMWPETASAQISSCMMCAPCPFESNRPNLGEICRGADPILPWLPIGRIDCSNGEEFCTCDLGPDYGWCYDQAHLSAEEQGAKLAESLESMRTGETIPADGLFFYVRRGADYVVRRKCDAAEVARVAIADAGSAATLGGG